MDGHVIYDIFERGLLVSKGRFVVDDYSQIRKDSASRDAGRESLEKKLRSLGYMQ